MPLFLPLVLLLGDTGRAAATYKNGPTQVLGFTADGASFVFIQTEVGQNDGDTRIRVIDTRTWEPHDYPLPVHAPTPEEKEQTRREQSRFAAWHKQHPTRCTGGLKSLDGKLVLRLAVTGNKLFVDSLAQGVQRVGAYAGPDGMMSGGATLDLFLEGQGDMWPPPQRWVLHWKEESTYHFQAKVTPCWAPDGRRLALYIERSDGFFRDPGTRELYLLPVSGPRVELRARRPRAPAVRAVALALDRAGFVVSQLSVSKKPPAVTTVRVRSEFAAELPKLDAVLGQITQDEEGAIGTMSDLVIELAEPSAAAPSVPAAAPGAEPTGAAGGVGEGAH